MRRKSRSRSFEHLDLDADAAFFREFDGIAHQVGQNLAEAHFVDADGAGHVARHRGDDLDTLGMGAGAQKFGDAVQQRAHIDFIFVQRQRAGFDLGEIQNIADQGRAALRRIG